MYHPNEPCLHTEEQFEFVRQKTLKSQSEFFKKKMHIEDAFGQGAPKDKKV